MQESKDFYSSREWRSKRYKVLRQNNGSCELCGRSKHQGVKLHVDHIEPRSLRPDLELSLSNLQVLCEDCNLGKSNRDNTDWRKHSLDDQLERLISLMVAMVLERPAIVSAIDGISLCEIAHLDLYPGGKVLFELIYLMRENASWNTANLLGYWYGTREGAFLSKIASVERIIDDESLDVRFLDSINYIISLENRDDTSSS